LADKSRDRQQYYGPCPSAIDHRSDFRSGPDRNVESKRTFVERVRNGKAEWVDVLTGLSVNGNIEVFGDLTPADEVIRNATDAIRSGQQVKTSSSHS
jgi:hypothetical protein